MRVVALLLCGLMLAGVSAQQSKKDEKKSEQKEDKKPPPKNEPTALEGAWSVVSVEVDGKEWPPEKIKGMQAVFAGNQLTIKRAKRILGHGTFTLDRSGSPAHLDYREAENVYSVYDTGIFELENASLRWCTTADRKKRPTKFDSKEGMLLVLKKAAKPPGIQ